MRPNHRTVLIVALVALALLVPACSSDGSEGTATTAATAATAATAGATSSTSGPGEAETTTSTMPTGSTTASAPACDPAAAIAAWPIERRAAQLVVVPVLDFDLADVGPVLARGVGGILFLGRAAATPGLDDRIEAAFADAGIDGVRPSVMADQEGGGVQRMKGVVDDVPWARDLGARSADDVHDVAERMGEQLLDAGVDVDLAPVLDVDGTDGPSATNPAGRRSFGATAEVASAAGLAYARGLEDAGVLPVAKHFPGLGGSSGNTDDGPAETRSIEDLRAEGLRPFEDAIAASVPAIMVANATVPGLTDLPASLSSDVIEGLLRDELGFRGLVMTDSLSAVAISSAGYDLPSAAVAAITAGADQVLFGAATNAGEEASLAAARIDATAGAMIEALSAAVADGSLPEERLDAAVDAVLRSKQVDPCAIGGSAG